MNLSIKNNAAMMMNLLGGSGVPFIFIIDFEAKQPVVLPFHEADSHEILYDIAGITNTVNPHSRINELFTFSSSPVSFDEYKTAFDKVMLNLEEGNSYLVNLTFPTPVETDLTLREIFFRSRAKYRLLYKDRFVLFSPETFVTITDGVISSFPMKGTIRADIPDAEKVILDDEKELAEHITIVDLIRNDLSIEAKNVEVKRFRYIDRVKTMNGDLLQVSSEITGELGPHWKERIGDTIFSLLPAGSVTGAPKRKTVEIIREAEKDSRGFYTGVCGCFDGSTLQSGVMIRFIENSSGRLLYRSGGGITVYSDAEKEYIEMADKVYVPFS